jgi:hypothetical protein
VELNVVACIGIVETRPPTVDGPDEGEDELGDVVVTHKNHTAINPLLDNSESIIIQGDDSRIQGLSNPRPENSGQSGVLRQAYDPFDSMGQIRGCEDTGLPTDALDTGVMISVPQVCVCL